MHKLHRPYNALLFSCSLAIMLLLNNTPALNAQATDTLTHHSLQLNESLPAQHYGPSATYPAQLADWAIPTLLVSVGTWAAYSEAFYTNNLAAKNFFDERRAGKYLHFDDYLQYLPLASYVALNWIAPSHNSEIDKGFVLSAAALVTTVFVLTGKHTTGILRPDQSTFNSFPSGHTATAFLGAELVRKEYGWGYGTLAYAAAVTVGCMRMYNQRHWLSDVIAGAGVGMLAANIGYMLLPYWQKTVHPLLKKKGRGVELTAQPAIMQMQACGEGRQTAAPAATFSVQF